MFGHELALTNNILNYIRERLFKTFLWKITHTGSVQWTFNKCMPTNGQCRNNVQREMIISFAILTYLIVPGRKENPISLEISRYIFVLFRLALLD